MTATASCPAVLIAAPASGQGKTTLTAALARLHARQGRRVSVFKCGPDFLDPFWLQLASGQPVHQLDLWMTGEADCRRRLHAAAQGSDLILVEGVMGLYDGQPSAADLAQHFGLPVLAVVDAGAMAGTFGAIAHGLQHYRDGLPWAGVMANRVGSDRHATMLQNGLKDPKTWLGALPRNPAWRLPERHLGLVAATEVADAMQRLDAAADVLAKTPLGQMDAAAFKPWTVEFPAPTPEPVPAALAGKTVAVARDAAFCFIYEANLACLHDLGARVVFFSPLRDADLPACDALWLPGGYPELHAEALSANHGLRAALQKHADQGKAIWAECGGMMVLFDTLVDKAGQTHAMWGLLPGRVTMQQRLAALGPQGWQGQGRQLRGHTFHHSLTETPLPPLANTVSPTFTDHPGEAIYAQGSIKASYFHAWFPSSPAWVAELLGATDPEAGAIPQGGAHP